jgi:hypothetical protein
MVNIHNYNQTERENLERILVLEEKEKRFWKTHSSCSRTELEKLENIKNGIRALNPVRYKDIVDEWSSSIYSTKGGYTRKLPLDETDSKIINIVGSYLPGWDFLQVRVMDSKPESGYVLIFKGEGNEEMLRTYLKKGSDNELGRRFLKKAGLDTAYEEIKSVLPEKDRLTGMNADLDEEWFQAEPPSINYDCLIIHLNIEDQDYMRRLKENRISSLRKSIERAEAKLKKYR